MTCFLYCGIGLPLTFWSLVAEALFEIWTQLVLVVEPTLPLESVAVVVEELPADGGPIVGVVAIALLHLKN
jgi:hypothetical protein